jgi:integrase
MTTPQPQGTDAQNPLAEPRDAYIDAKSVGTDDAPGRYARNADSILTEFTDWAHHSQMIKDLEQLTTDDIRAYVRRLRKRWRDDELAASTTQVYFATVRAWLAWCVRNGWLDTNPAEDDDAMEDLPEGDDDQGESRQRWGQQARHDLIQYVRAQTDSAYADPIAPPDTRVMRARDRALVAVLAKTGVRGAEVFRDVENSEREGLHWRDVDDDEGTLYVWGKSGENEYVPYPESAQGAVDTWRRELQPSSVDWPVFPSLSANSLSAAIRKSRNGTVPDHEVDRAVDNEGYLQGYLRLAREYDESPRAMTTTAARNVLERLSAAAGVSGTDGEYLKPHGARRQLGDDLYRENPAMAQRALRHSNIEVTQESYSYIDAGEVGDEIDRVHDE